VNNLGRLYARIEYYPTTWEETVIEDGFIRPGEWGKRWWDWDKSPTETNRRFWKDVRQLYFDFEGGAWDRIRVFYAQYGPVWLLGCRWGGEQMGSVLDARFCSEDLEAEGISQVMHHLNWFRELTMIVQHIKQRKAAPLWERFEAARRAWEDVSSTYRTVKERRALLWRAEQELGEHFGAPGVYMIDRPRGRDESFILEELPPPIRLPVMDDYPADDDQLYAAAWEAVLEVVGIVFDSIPCDFSGRGSPTKKKKPQPVLRLYPPAALAAAFLQWFFQEVSPVNVAVCAAEDCDLPVLPPYKRYCSRRCREREKKRKWRRKVRDGQ